MKKFLKSFDWVNLLRIVLLIIFLFYINFYLVNSYVLKGATSDLSLGFQSSLHFSLIAYILSIVGISFYLVKDLSKTFFIKLVSGYFIWSNYETEKLSYPSVTSSDFPALVLKQTNSKVSPYYALLTDILEAENQSSEDFESLSSDLKIIQYDLTLGKNYITKIDENFF